MAFTVQDLNDLLVLLEQHPEWKARLRQVLLTDEVLRLPQAVERLTEAVQELVREAQEARQWRQDTDAWRQEISVAVEALIREAQEARQWRQDTDAWRQEISVAVEALIREAQEARQWRREMDNWRQEMMEWQREISVAVEALVREAQEARQWRREMDNWRQEMSEWRREMMEWQRQINGHLLKLLEWQEMMAAWQQRAERDLSKLKGAEREWYYRLRAPALFGLLVRKGRDATNEVIERLHDAVKAGQISKAELRAVRDADLLWLGEFEGTTLLLVGEVSYTVNHEDIMRAAQRAEIARKIGYRAVPLVAGVEISEEVQQQARFVGAIVMSDGEMDIDFAEQLLRQAIA